LGQECRPRRRLLLPGEVAGVGFGEDAEFDQALQLGPGAFGDLRQQVVAEGLADVLGSQGPVTSLEKAKMRG
jgi:hypothetical protein